MLKGGAHMVETFRMLPPNGGPWWFIGIFGIIVLGLLVLFICIGFSAWNTKFIVTPQGLRIAGTLYGRFIPKDQILTGLARSVNLSVETDYRPSWRTNGIGMPGYGAGWFKLKNGEKALMFLTDKSNVVCIPTTRGYSLVVSVSDPRKFVDSLKKAAFPQ